MNNLTKFEIGVAEMKKVISQLEPVFKGDSGNLSRVLFQVQDKITAYATNGESYVKMTFECNIFEKGDFVVSGETLADIVKNATGEKIEFSTTDDNRLSILAGKVKYRIALMDINTDYLMPPENDSTKNFIIDAQDLKTAISSISCCIDQGKPHLNCVVIHSNPEEKNKVYVVATDGMRLGIAERKAKFDEQIPNLLLPKKAADYIITMIGDKQGDLEIKYTENMVQILSENIYYTSKLLDINFPKYQAVIPTKNDKILEVKTADFKEIIKRITKVSGGSMYGIKITLHNDNVEVSFECDGNDAHGDLEATFNDQNEMSIICNYRLLLEILEKIQSNIVRFQILENSTPILIRSVNDESVKYVFMPFVN